MFFNAYNESQFGYQHSSVQSFVLGLEIRPQKNESHTCFKQNECQNE